MVDTCGLGGCWFEDVWRCQTMVSLRAAAMQIVNLQRHERLYTTFVFCCMCATTWIFTSWFWINFIFWCFGKFAPTCGRIYHAGRQVISGDDVNVQVDAGRVYFQHHKQLEEVAANAFLDVELPFDLKTRTTTDLVTSYSNGQEERWRTLVCGSTPSQNWTNNFVPTPRGHQSRPSNKTRSSIEGFCM